MTPAALHRESSDGNDSEFFLRLGSGLVVAATLPLALGVAADVYVVFIKITTRPRSRSRRVSCCCL
jgi:hypothetical protein